MPIPRRRILRLLAAVSLVLAAGAAPSTQVLGPPVGPTVNWQAKLDPLLLARPPLGSTRVVLRVANAAAVSPILTLVQSLGGRLIRRLPILDSMAVDIPNLSLPIIASDPLVARMSMDRLTAGAVGRTRAAGGRYSRRPQLS